MQWRCSGVYFSNLWRPLWSWTEYIGKVWNLRQPIDKISGSLVFRMRLCQRCFLKRTWKTITESYILIFQTQRKELENTKFAIRWWRELTFFLDSTWFQGEKAWESIHNDVCRNEHWPEESPSYPRSTEGHQELRDIWHQSWWQTHRAYHWAEILLMKDKNWWNEIFLDRTVSSAYH